MVEFLSENMAGQIILGTGIFEAIPLNDTLIYGIIFLGLVAKAKGSSHYTTNQLFLYLFSFSF